MARCITVRQRELQGQVLTHSLAHILVDVDFADGLGVPKDYDKARKYWTMAANQEHTQGQYHLAKMYHHGIGNVQSCPTAVKLYKAVAEKGEWAQQLVRALELYEQGDADKAVLVYEKLAHRGFELAQHNAAWVYDSASDGSISFAPSQDERYASALYYYRRAAEQGNSNAHLKLGDYYYYGRGGVAVDYEKAASYYRFASGMKNAQATFNIGYMHQVGHGVPHDLHLAKRFFDMSLEDNPDAYLAVMVALAGWAAHYAYAAVLGFELADLTAEFSNGLYGYQWDTIAITLLCGILLIAMRNRLGRM